MRRFHAKVVAWVSLSIIASLLLACSSPLRTAGVSEVTISTGLGNRSVALPAFVAGLRLTVSAADLEPVSYASEQGGWTLQLDSGPERLFVVEALDAAGVAVYRGEATSDLEHGTRVSLSVAMAFVSFAIEYKLDGGKNPADASVAFTVADTVSLPVPYKSGQEFVGWFDNSSLSGDALSSFAAGTAGDKTLYAKWKERGLQFSIDFSNPEQPVFGLGSAYTVSKSGSGGYPKVITVSVVEPEKFEAVQWMHDSGAISGATGAGCTIDSAVYAAGTYTLTVLVKQSGRWYSAAFTVTVLN